jgi:hypothetical protein
MSKEFRVRLLAGSIVLTGTLLGAFVNHWFLLIPGFAGANLIQSAFTGFCPPEKFLGGKSQSS